MSFVMLTASLPRDRWVCADPVPTSPLPCPFCSITLPQVGSLSVAVTLMASLAAATTVRCIQHILKGGQPAIGALRRLRVADPAPAGHHRPVTLFVPRLIPPPTCLQVSHPNYAACVPAKAMAGMATGTPRGNTGRPSKVASAAELLLPALPCCAGSSGSRDKLSNILRVGLHALDILKQITDGGTSGRSAVLPTPGVPVCTGLSSAVTSSSTLSRSTEGFS